VCARSPFHPPGNWQVVEILNKLTLLTLAWRGNRDSSMTNTVTAAPEHSHRPHHPTAAGLPANGGQSIFNPLHPSMALPPEQLIRLLGLQDKKYRATETSRSITGSRPHSTGSDSRTASAVPPGRGRHRSLEQANDRLFGKQLHSRLLRLLGFGSVVILALSVYRLQGQTALPGMSPAPTAAGSRSLTVFRPAIPYGAEWRTTIQLRERHLRIAAQRRLQEKLLQSRYLTTSTPADGRDGMAR